MLVNCETGELLFCKNQFAPAFQDKKYMKHTKTRIIASIGPASETQDTIEKLIRAGASIFRVSYSIGKKHELEERFAAITRAIRATKAPHITTLQDFGGLKIRLENEHSIKVEKGHIFLLCSHEVPANAVGAKITSEYFWNNVRRDSLLYVGDGQIALRAQKITKGCVFAEVLFSGTIGPRKGITIPGMTFGFGENIKMDAELAIVGANLGYDFVALSFVERAEDIRLFKRIIAAHAPGYKPKILAKIETRSAVRNIDAILKETDGVMIARGDLALQTDFTDLPAFQSMIIKKCRQKRKFVIVATQMLESLMHSYIPFRAEITDVANAVREGATAVMLSGETTVGDDPVHAVEVMRKIIEKTERMARK